MRVKQENFHLLEKYGFYQGFYMEDYNNLRFEISDKDHWVRFNHIDHDIYIVINKYGEICVHNVGGGIIEYDIPLPDVLIKMCKDGIIETQDSVLIDAAKEFYRDQLKEKDLKYLSEYVMELDNYELVATFLLYVLKNNVYKGLNVKTRFNLYKKSDNQLVVYIMDKVNKIKHAYLAQDMDGINDIIKKHFHDENVLITQVDCWDKEQVKYLKLNGVTAYKY